MLYKLTVKSIAIILFGLFLTGCASNSFWELDRIIRDTKTEIGMQSGTAVIVVQDDEIIHEAYFGFADIEQEVPVDENSVFYFASTTKALLGLAILLLEDQNEISENTTLQEMFPSLDFSDINADLITVKHLLTHTSGIDNEPLTWSMSYTGLHGPASHRLKMIANSYPSQNAKLGDFEYSNIGYNILVTWMEENYGRDWRDTFKAILLEPLKMRSTTGYVSLVKKQNWPLVRPYSYKVSDGKKALYLNKTDATMYSVGLMSTARDFSKFLLATMNDGKLENVQVFPRAVLQKQREEQIEYDGRSMEGYAWGWMTGKQFEQPLLFHTGGFPGSSVSISYMPDEKTGLVIVHNESGLKANVLSGIIQTTAYALALDKKNGEIDSLIREDLDWLVDASIKARIKLEKDTKNLKTSNIKISLKVADYAGVYSNSMSGDISVSVSPDEQLVFQWGLLRGTGYSTNTLDTVQVNFRPGSSDKLSFKIENGHLISLTFNGVEFEKK